MRRFISPPSAGPEPAISDESTPGTQPMMRSTPPRRTHGWASSSVAGAQRRRDAIHRRSGAAYLQLAGTVEHLASVLGIHHTGVVRRRQGQGGLANILEEVDAWERNGVDTTPLLEAWIDTMLEARAARMGSASVTAFDLSRREQALGYAVDREQLDFHEQRPGAVPRLAKQLARYLAVALPLAGVLKREAVEVSR